MTAAVVQLAVSALVILAAFLVGRSYGARDVELWRQRAEESNRLAHAALDERPRLRVVR